MLVVCAPSNCKLRSSSKPTKSSNGVSSRDSNGYISLTVQQYIHYNIIFFSQWPIMSCPKTLTFPPESPCIFRTLYQIQNVQMRGCMVSVWQRSWKVLHMHIEFWSEHLRSKRHFGRRRRRCEDNIKIDGGDIWLLVFNRDQWRVVLTRVIKFRVSKRMGITWPAERLSASEAELVHVASYL
jgi:hypothetical protein